LEGKSFSLGFDPGSLGSGGHLRQQELRSAISNLQQLKYLSGEFLHTSKIFVPLKQLCEQLAC